MFMEAPQRRDSFPLYLLICITVLDSSRKLAAFAFFVFILRSPWKYVITAL